MARFPTFLLLALLTALLATPSPANAQGRGIGAVTVTETTLRANAVLEQRAPETVSITFSTGIAPDTSDIRIFDESGEELSGTSVAWDGNTATLSLPPNLPNGTWLVAWDVAAAEGDAGGSGFYGFTVGADQNVAPLTLPGTGFDTPAGPAWLARLATGALVLGTLVLIATWPVRTLLRHTSPLPPSRRGQSLATIAAGLAALGALGRLVAEAWSHPDDAWADGLLAVLGDARPGWALLAALALSSLHSVLLAVLPPSPKGFLRLLPWVSTVALAIPLALLTHAADEPAGRIPTLTVTVVGLLALAALAGGAVALVLLRAPLPDRARLVMIIAAPVLLLAGAYLAWLYIGNGAALATTTYGALATVTAVVCIAFLLALGAATLASRRWLVVPALLGVVLAGLTGTLMVTETARARIEQEATQRVLPLTLDGDRAQLILAPGAAGVNHVRLEVDRASLPLQTEATMTLALPAQPELGSQRVQLSRVIGGAFEYHGAELAIAGDWQVTVTLAELGRPAAEATATLPLPEDAEPVDAPGTPWRFTDFAGSAGVLMVTIGIAGLAIGIAAGRSPARRESLGLGIAALVLAAILLGQGRLDPILAAGGAGGAGAIDPDDLTLITRGEAIYAEQCLSCHGPELRGDGPGAAGMQPPPADFAEPHTRAHDEATLIYWVRHGKQGTAMPAFGDVLFDEEIRAVLSYIEREQRNLADPATPSP